MDKRVTGVTIIVAGLLAVVVLSGLRGRLVPGVAGHGPSVRTGECAQLTPPAQLGDSTDITRSPVPVATWVDCADPRAGTVIGGTTRTALPETETPIGYTNLMDECASPLQSYLFGRIGGDYSWDVTGSHLTFRPATLVRAFPARAAAAQAPGVCVLGRPATGDAVAPVVVDPDRPGDAIGICLPSWEERRYLACDRPHLVEVMGLVTDRRIRLGISLRGQDGCTAFLALATGRQDPTFGGQLRVLLDPITTDDSETVMCGLGVTDPSRALSGSLIGIDDRPIPWV